MEYINIEQDKYKMYYSYENAPTLRKFALSDARNRVVSGPIGSGTTSACIMEIIRKGIAQKPCKDGIRRTRWIVVAPTYEGLRDGIIPSFEAWFPIPFFGGYYPTKYMYVIDRILDVHIEILFRAANCPEHISNLAFIEATGTYVSHASEIPFDVINTLSAHIGRYPALRDGGPSWYGTIMDTYPPPKNELDHWLNKIKECNNWEIFKQPSGLSEEAENTANLPKDYYKMITENKTEEWLDRYVRNVWDS